MENLATGDAQINKRSYTQNRELSWLKFNERVLEEAEDSTVPLMERLKFVSIFTSNLDEFFMIRVGSLFDLASLDEQKIDNRSAMTPKEQLAAIYKAVEPLYKKKTEVYENIKSELKGYGVSPLDYNELEKSDIKFIKDYYKFNIKPVLSPQVVDTHHPFPHIANKDIYIMAILKQKGGNVLGLLPVPNTLPEVLILPGSDLRYIRMEKILFQHLDEAFENYEILEKNCLCITRNADINPDDESFEVEEDFRIRMKKLLRKRKRLDVVRLEANYPISNKFKNILCDRFQITSEQIFISSTTLKMGYVFGLYSKLSPAQKSQITYPDFTPVKSNEFNHEESLIKQIKEKDFLLSYPYESMNPFLQLIKEAANDPFVVSIRITIYRLAKKAKLVEYLCAAAENGKDVTVLMELRARFDEQNNIDWSEELEEAGCKILYGHDEYKVHSKVCLITRKEKNGFAYITQIGTGNYNEKTAELYTDLSLFTANYEIGNDAAEFFKNISIGNTQHEYNRLIVAPVGLKHTLLELIDKEIIKGSAGKIFMKMNSLTDIDFIDKLVLASKAGVTVHLLIRGICCLLPNIPGETDNIHISSIVGRYLEHSRIYSFGRGSNQNIYIASADLMTRNTEKRIEVGCPILDDRLKSKINEMISFQMQDNVKSRILCSNGDYIKKEEPGALLDSQELFMKRYSKQTQLVNSEKNKKGFFKKLFSAFKRK